MKQMFIWKLRLVRKCKNYINEIEMNQLKLFLIITFLLSVISGRLLAQNSNREWQLIGLENLSIEHVYVKGDSIWAGTLDSTFKSEIYYSFSGGEEWLKVADSDTLLNGWLKLLRVSPYNILTIYASAFNGRGLKSTDGGVSWEFIFPDFEPWPQFLRVKKIHISPHNEKLVFGIVAQWSVWESLYRTTDGGVEWEYINAFASSPHGSLLSFAFDPVDSMKMYVAGDNRMTYLAFYASNNKGEQWNVLSELLSAPWEIMVDWNNNDIIYVIPIRSEDGGLNWVRLVKGLPYGWQYWSSIIDRYNSSILYMSIKFGVYKTTNKGELWTLISGSENLDLNFSSGVQGENDNLFIDPVTNNLYVGTKRGLYVYDLLTAIIYEAESFPSNFILHQNYPNPFNPSTTIKYEIQSSGFITLKIYDILGNEIATLVNEKQSAGSYEVTFNIGSIRSYYNFTSGVYIYQIKAGGYVSSRKMIYLK